jgi:hypothetical protein
MDLKKIALLGVDWIRVARNNGQWLSFWTRFERSVP